MVSGKVRKMKLNNRITLFTVILVISALVVLPSTIAQTPGPGGRGGSPRGAGGRGGGRGDMNVGGRGMDRGGGGRRGMRPFREELTDTQINLILKAYSTRDPEGAKKLEEQREDMTRETFVQTLISQGYARSEYFTLMNDEMRYTPILDWCERWVADEAKGIRELKEDNYQLYKDRLDTLDRKYGSIINGRYTEEEIPVRVRLLQLQNKLGELTWQIRTAAETQEKKDSIEADIREVLSERYNLNTELMTIQLKGIQREIERVQSNYDFVANLRDRRNDPNVAENEIQRDFERIINPGFYQRGRGGRRQGFTVSAPAPAADANAPN